MFWASLCPSSGAYQLQQQPLVYRWNVVVAVLLVVVGPVVGSQATNPRNCCIWLVDSFEWISLCWPVKARRLRDVGQEDFAVGKNTSHLHEVYLNKQNSSAA